MASLEDLRMEEEAPKEVEAPEEQKEEEFEEKETEEGEVDRVNAETLGTALIVLDDVREFLQELDTRSHTFPFPFSLKKGLRSVLDDVLDVLEDWEFTSPGK